MQILFFNTTQTILLDLILWLIIHLTIGYFSSRIPLDWLNPEQPFFQTFDWEKDGEINVRFILDHQVGAVANTPKELNNLVNDWLKDDEAALQAMAINARRCGHPEAALVIADALWLADENQIP